MKAYGRSHTRKETKKTKATEALKDLRAKPGMSNSGKYDSSDAPFAGPHQTYPLGKDGKIDPDRVAAAKMLAHHLGKAGANKLRKNIARILTQKHKLPSLVARIRKGQ